MAFFFSNLSEYLAYPFVRYALITGVLISLCSSVLGVSLVLKRFSFIGDGLSHVAFGAMAVAGVMGLSNNMPLTLIITVVSAVLMLSAGKNAKIKGDAAVAMISVGALAVGYLLMNIFPSTSNVSGDVCSTLFGSSSILTLTKTDVIVCAVMSAAVLILFVLFYNKIFAVTFDEDFARSAGIKTKLYNIMIAVSSAVIIVLAMNLVGSLLISALIIFPALSAMRMFRSFKSVVIASAVFSVICSVAGILISVSASTPVGATVVAADIAGFFVSCAVGRIIKKA